MKEQWAEILESLKKMLDSGIFKVWVAPLSAEVEADCLRIFAPNPFMAEWIKKRLYGELRKAAEITLGAAIRIEIGARAVEEAATVPGQPRQAPLPVPAPNFRQVARWRHCFEDFVTGPSNSIAFAAARDICQMGDVRTLFVNSASGLGKTHLAQAAGNAITSAGSPIKVAYLTGEQFASRYVAAMRAKELEDFKSYLCGLDALLLEDVHFFQRKKAMQELLLGVIKNLQAKGARVILTSSFTPRQMRDIDSQLISRFCSGILTSMERPDMETRRQILQRKAKFHQVILPDDVCDLLSRRLSSDVRQLESCLSSLIYKARLLNSGLNVDLALETVDQYACSETSLDLEGIVQLVCESFGVSREQLKSRSRRQEYVRGRNTVFYLARKHTDMNLEEIGCVFNRRHSTVMRGITQVEQEIARESVSGRQIARAVSLIERKCGLGGGNVSD